MKSRSQDAGASNCQGQLLLRYASRSKVVEEQALFDLDVVSNQSDSNQRTWSYAVTRNAALPYSRSRIRKNANFDCQAIPNNRISCALRMLLNPKRCRRLNVRFSTPAD